MFDLINQNGWGGDTYTLLDVDGNIVAHGTLQEGQIINADFPGDASIIQGTVR